MKFNQFEDIVAWQKAIQLSVDVYQVFEDSRDWGFKNQIQRAAVSVSNNIAEGFERQTNAEFCHFLYTAKGSCGEVRSMVYLAKELMMITEEQYQSLMAQCFEISRMLSSLIKTLSPNSTPAK